MCDNLRQCPPSSIRRHHEITETAPQLQARSNTLRLYRGVVDDDNMAWRAPALAGATSAAMTTTAALVGLLVYKRLCTSTRILVVANVTWACCCPHGPPVHTQHDADQAGDKVQAMNLSTITEVQGLQHHDAHMGQLQNEVEPEAADLQVPAAVNRSTQPIEAPAAAAEYKAGDDQGDTLDRAMPEPAAGDSRQLQPEHPSPFEEAVPLEQEESVAWGSFCSADPEGEGALRDDEDEYHVVGLTGALGYDHAGI